VANWTFTSFAQAKTDLASKLDKQKVFWNDAEYGTWIVESLRAWGAAAQFYRNRATFNTIAGQAFYDLTSTADCGAGPTNPPALLGYALTDRNVVNQLQYNLLEPLTTNWVAGTPAMTEMFTLAELQAAVQRRRDQFFLETGPVLAHSVLVGPPAGGNGRLGLPDTVVDVRRVVWKDATTGALTQLWREDEFAANGYRYGWAANPGDPAAYSVYLVPHVGLQLIPPPANPGSVDLITLNDEPDLNVAAGVLLFVPDDFAWGVRFGALADLLSKDGQASDPTRAKYCEQRYQESVQLARLGAMLQTASINGVQVPIQSFRDADGYSAGWQNASGVPTTLLNDSNIVALTPTPDANSYSVEIDAVVNTPVPTADTDFLQVGREQYDVILGYAAHLAAFKMGGVEFEATMPGYENLMKLAAQNNDRLRAQASNFAVFQERSQREERDRPTRRAAA
jgi:hypothetical protein